MDKQMNYEIWTKFYGSVHHPEVYRGIESHGDVVTPRRAWEIAQLAQGTPGLSVRVSLAGKGFNREFET